jgi:O-antigen/teichoic acid export membrane protein
MQKEKVAPMKQVVLYAIINYAGTAIGIFSSLLIYPLDFEFLGTVRFVDNISQLLFPVMVLGASHALIKFYPTLDDTYRKQLFNYSLLSVTVISIIALLGIVLFSIGTNYKDAALLYAAFPIAVSLAFVELFKKQAQDLQKIAVPTLYEKILPKIALPIIFLLLLGNYLGLVSALIAYAASYILIFILTAIYLFKRFNPGFNYRFKTLFGEISRKDYFRYSLYSFAGSLGSLLAFRIDGIVIYNLISKEANGVFSTAVTLASTLQIPAVGMFALYAPIISGYLKSGNFRDLNVKYKEIARLLFFIGALLYSCIFLGIEDLFRLLPAYEKLKDTIPVIIVLGFSVLINMATGFNGEIITYSKYYRFNLVAILVLILLNVSLNLYFIYYTGMGIMGVAYASFIAMTLFNIAKLIFIYKKFRLLPFDNSFVKLAVIFLLSAVGIYLLPDASSHIINLFYKLSLSLLINIFVIYRLRLVYQVNVWMDKGFAKLF